jgi:hypothetical protein
MNRPDPNRPPDAAPPRIAAERATPFPLVLLVLTTAILLAGVLYWFDPRQHTFYPVCFFHQLTGLHCPGCGGLRAVHHLAHGEILTAFHCNPLLVAALPFAGMLAFRWLKQGSAAASASLGKVAGILLVVLLIFGVLRNLPGPAFAWMSP